MTDQLCQCPFLQMAAEAERMAGCGIVPIEADSAVQLRINAILVGRLRAEHNCTGPGRVTKVCKYYYETHNWQLTADPNVPLLKPVKDGQDHKYI